MELKRCLFGCLLALASVGTAAATGVTTQDPTAPHATIVDSSSHDGGAGGDAPGTGRDCTPPGPAGDSADDSDGGSSGGGGVATPHPHASRHSSLGWQSLLPGAIQ